MKECKIITKNMYLMEGLLSLIGSEGVAGKFLFIDIDSYTSLFEIMRSLDYINDDYTQCHIIKGTNPNSKALSHIASFDGKAPLMEIIKSINNTAKINKLGVIKELSQYADLSILSANQKKIAQAASRNRSIPEAARSLNVNIKTADSRVRAIMKKMNFKSINDIRWFIIRNNINSFNNETFALLVCRQYFRPGAT